MSDYWPGATYLSLTIIAHDQSLTTNRSRPIAHDQSPTIMRLQIMRLQIMRHQIMRHQWVSNRLGLQQVGAPTDDDGSPMIHVSLDLTQ
jgi:hypothetical protein